MRRGATEGNPPVDPVREIDGGDTIAASVLRDFLLTCLRHDALRDATNERLDALEREGRLDISVVAKTLREMVGDLNAAVKFQDWLSVSGALMDAYRDAAPALPVPNARQAEEIEATEALFASNPDVELLRWTVIDPAEFLREGQTAGGIYIEFQYRALGDEPGERPGREVTVFAEDGAVLDSQDFG